MHYAAGVLFSNGTTASARADLALEWGGTLDAVGKLAAGIQARPAGVDVEAVVHVDQWGM